MKAVNTPRLPLQVALQCVVRRLWVQVALGDTPLSAKKALVKALACAGVCCSLPCSFLVFSHYVHLSGPSCWVLNIVVTIERPERLSINRVGTRKSLFNIYNLLLSLEHLLFVVVKFECTLPSSIVGLGVCCISVHLYWTECFSLSTGLPTSL